MGSLSPSQNECKTCSRIAWKISKYELNYDIPCADVPLPSFLDHLAILNVVPTADISLGLEFDRRKFS